MILEIQIQKKGETEIRILGLEGCERIEAPTHWSWNSPSIKRKGEYWLLQDKVVKVICRGIGIFPKSIKRDLKCDNDVP